MMLGHSNFFSMVGEALSLFRENKQYAETKSNVKSTSKVYSLDILSNVFILNEYTLKFAKKILEKKIKLMYTNILFD